MSSRVVEGFMASAARSGLDIGLGNRCSETAYAWTQKTFAARADKPGRVHQDIEASFASLIDIGGATLGISSDGIGTKIELAERVGAYGTLGYDLTAMVADDLAANGIEPTNLSNILDVDHLDHAIVDELMRGLCEAAAGAGIALTGGEIAELGARVGGWGERMHFNWSATAIGILPAGVSPIDGRACRSGDAVIAIQERGLRSNGFSLVRRIMTAAFGERWHERPFDGTRQWGEVLLTPSLVCAPLVSALLRTGVHLHGVANITGGGIPHKLGRVLRVRQLGARLDGLFSPPEGMQALIELGRLSLREGFEHWNMGNAMLLILPAQEVDAALATAKHAGFAARLAGETTSEPSMRIGAAGEIAFATPEPRRGSRQAGAEVEAGV